jgi:hypothetical protein
VPDELSVGCGLVTAGAEGAPEGIPEGAPEELP